MFGCPRWIHNHNFMRCWEGRSVCVPEAMCYRTYQMQTQHAPLGYPMGISNEISQGMCHGIYQWICHRIFNGISKGICHGIYQGISNGISQGISKYKRIILLSNISWTHRCIFQSQSAYPAPAGRTGVYSPKYAQNEV